MSEDQSVPRILVAVLTTHERIGWVHPEILFFIEAQRSNTNYAWSLAKVHNFVPAAAARNVFCNAAKDTGCDWILMVDNDMALPYNLFDCIKDAPEDAAVVVPRFHLWDETNRRITMCWGMDAAEFKNGALVLDKPFYELTKCGTGAIFIRPEVFKQIPAPWFTYLYDEMGNMQGTEDIQFAFKVKDAGLKIYGNPRFVVGHYRSCNLAVLADVLQSTKGVDNQSSEGVSSESSKLTERPSEASVATARPAC
jgi:hypothetical protein